MPSFDIVSKVDLQEIENALNSVRREIEQRYDFKGSKCTITREEEQIVLLADDHYKLEQIHAMLKVHMTRRKVDAKSLDFGKIEPASGGTLRQTVTIKQGIEGEIAKQITKEIKNSKLKVQASIRGDEIRVEGKKRDDLQEVMSLVRALNLSVPVQFMNFRD